MPKVNIQKIFDNPEALETLRTMLRQQAELDLAEIEQNGDFNMTGQGYDDTAQQRGILPSRFGVTQAYGNYNPALYKGINQSMTNTGTDFGAPTGTSLALPSGNWRIADVKKNGFNSGYGNTVFAEDEDTGEKLRFSHLSDARVIPGQRLRGGSVIGKSGATGNVTGAHLDLEYYDKGGKVGDILKSRYAKELYAEE